MLHQELLKEKPSQTMNNKPHSPIGQSRTTFISTQTKYGAASNYSSPGFFYVIFMRIYYRYTLQQWAQQLVSKLYVWPQATCPDYCATLHVCLCSDSTHKAICCGLFPVFGSWKQTETFVFRPTRVCFFGPTVHSHLPKWIGLSE